MAENMLTLKGKNSQEKCKDSSISGKEAYEQQAVLLFHQNSIGTWLISLGKTDHGNTGQKRTYLETSLFAGLMESKSHLKDWNHQKCERHWGFSLPWRMAAGENQFKSSRKIPLSLLHNCGLAS
jgi:hypothetical protein